MKTVLVKNIKRDSLASQFYSIYEALRDVDFKDSISVNFEAKWLYPLMILPFCAYIQCIGGENKNENNSYLNAINFPDGVSSVSEFQKKVQRNKNFIPISVLKSTEEKNRGMLVDQLTDLIIKIINPTGEFSNNLTIPIFEMVDNISEHSKANKGFIFAQYYPQGSYIDVCVVDCGRGFVNTYKEEKGIVFTDEEALAKVLQGFSAKKEKGRGEGICNSRRMICEGLLGEFILASGSSVFVANKEYPMGKVEFQPIHLPNFYWQGTIVAFRMPKPKKEFNFSEFFK
ncbi:hypothetical protein M0R01_00525 [bacterium]|nr:hypothetical protein [bacterium]